MDDASARKRPLPRKKQPRRDGTVPYVRYSPKVAQEICERLARGEIWFKICNTGRLPSYDTLYRWIRTKPEFAEAYAQAKAMAADLRADKALAVAEAATPATIQCDRLHVSTLQWHAAKAAPGKYGARREETDEAGGRLIVEVKQFERAYRADGSAYIREVLPDGEANAEGQEA